MRFTFPDNEFRLSSNPNCYAVSLFGVQVEGSLACTNTSGVVKLTGLTKTIQIGTYVLIRVQVANPPAAITTSTFTIETGR